MIRYQEDNFLMEMSSLEATFSDGSLINDDVNVTVKRDTPLGTEVWIVNTASAQLDGDNNLEPAKSTDEASSSRIIRLIFIPPGQDWRSNQTYAWKLDSAWMSTDESSSDCTWLHWNVQSYIDSAIQVPEANDVWECDGEVELHFRPIREKAFGSSSYPVVRNERLVLRNVRFGLGPSLDSGNIISPCRNGGSIVDGEIRNGVLGSELNGPTKVSTSQRTRILEGSFLVLFCIALVMLAGVGWRRYQRALLYHQLSPTEEEDLTLTVEDTHQGTETRSTVKGIVNNTG